MRAFARLDRQLKPLVLAIMLLVVGLLGWIDYLTGIEISFSVFYFLPVAGATWFVSRRAGVAAAGASAATWLLADLYGGHTYPSALIGMWNTTARLLSFLVLAGLLGALRRAYQHEMHLARSDALTGAWNRRRFFELLELEIGRARRSGRVFTIVHFDIDGFKAVNDLMGHGEGDRVLRATVEATERSLRASDVLARLGGDEFAILLPETQAEAARIAVAKVQASLMEEMGQRQWPVSFSLGVLTCLDPPATPDELVRRVDALTYAAKNGGKNIAVYDVTAPPAPRRGVAPS